MNLKEKTVSQNYIFKGKIINLRQDIACLPNGNNATREVIEHPGGVSVVAINDNDEIIMVRQFRYPYMENVLEIPAGKRDSKDENTLDCAIRELKEETGATAKSFISLGEIYPTPGYCSEIIYIYLANELEFGECCPDEDEFLETVKIKFDKAVEMVINNEIKDAKTAVGILRAKAILNR